MNEKISEVIKDFFQALIKEWVKARTIFTCMFYAVFLFMVVSKTPIPPELNTIISTLFGFWFGQKQTKKEGEKQ